MILDETEGWARLQQCVCVGGGVGGGGSKLAASCLSRFRVTTAHSREVIFTKTVL